MMQVTQTYNEGTWHEGNIRLFGVEEYASWLGMSVFDGARAFDGLFPDGDLHAQRSIRSAEALGMKPSVGWEFIYQLCVDGIHKFVPGTHLYIRIEFWDQTKLASGSTGTGFAIVIEEIPLTHNGFTANVSKYKRVNSNQAPTSAKASCLYPMSVLAVKQANKEGFQDCVMCSQNGNVAEFSMSNLFLVKDGVIITPQANDTFLNGITRQRLVWLFRAAGYKVEDNRDVLPAELDHADEIFATGNYHKIQPVVRFNDRRLKMGPATKLGLEIYVDYAQKFKV